MCSDTGEAPCIIDNDGASGGSLQKPVDARNIKFAAFVIAGCRAVHFEQRSLPFEVRGSIFPRVFLERSFNDDMEFDVPTLAASHPPVMLKACAVTVYWGPRMVTSAVRPAAGLAEEAVAAIESADRSVDDSSCRRVLQ